MNVHVFMKRTIETHDYVTMCASLRRANTNTMGSHESARLYDENRDQCLARQPTLDPLKRLHQRKCTAKSSRRSCGASKWSQGPRGLLSRVLLGSCEVVPACAKVHAGFLMFMYWTAFKGWCQSAAASMHSKYKYLRMKDPLTRIQNFLFEF